LISALNETARGVFLTVKATPKAAHTQIAGIRGGAVMVKVTDAPEKGKANLAVAALLAKAIGVPRSAFELVSGETNRNKVFKLASHVEQVQTWLQGLQRD
jgi:uncharacterized protein